MRNYIIDVSQYFYSNVLSSDRCTVCFIDEVWESRGRPSIFESGVKGHLHTLMTGKVLALPEFYFLCRLCYYKKTSLKFLPNYTSRTLQNSVFIFNLKVPLGVPVFISKAKDLKVFKFLLVGSCWNVTCIPYLPEFLWTRTQKQFPVKVIQKISWCQFIYSGPNSKQIAAKVAKFPHWFKKASFVGTNTFPSDFIYYINSILLEINSFCSPSVTQDLEISLAL